MNGPISTNEFLVERNDAIYNSVFDAIQKLTRDECEIEWDMSIIGDVTDAIVAVLVERGINVCYPWHDENENICYEVDRCFYCKKGGSRCMSFGW